MKDHLDRRPCRANVCVCDALSSRPTWSARTCALHRLRLVDQQGGRSGQCGRRLQIIGVNRNTRRALSVSSYNSINDCAFRSYRIERNHSRSLRVKYWVSSYWTGMGKVTIFKFCTHIHRIDRNKSPLKISAKVAVGVFGDSQKFSGHSYIGRMVHREVIFCGSSAFLFHTYTERRFSGC